MNKTSLIHKAMIILVSFFAATQANALAADPVTTDEARVIAKEAYIFNYSMVMMYRTMYVQSIDTTSGRTALPGPAYWPSIIFDT